MTFNQIVAAQRLYIAKRYGKAAVEQTEYGIGSDNLESFVESLIRRPGQNLLILASYVTNGQGKTSNIHLSGRPNSLKHVVSVVAQKTP